MSVPPLQTARNELVVFVAAYNINLGLARDRNVKPLSKLKDRLGHVDAWDPTTFYWKWKGRLPVNQFEQLKTSMQEHIKQQSETEANEVFDVLVEWAMPLRLEDCIALRGINILPVQRLRLLNRVKAEIYPVVMKDAINLANEAFSTYPKDLAKKRRDGLPPEKLPRLYPILMGKASGPSPAYDHGIYFQSKITLPAGSAQKVLNHCRDLLRQRSDEEEQSIKNAFRDTTRVWNRYTASGRHQRANAIEDLQKQYRASLMHDYRHIGINLQAPAGKRLLAHIETSPQSSLEKAIQELNITIMVYNVNLEAAIKLRVKPLPKLADKIYKHTGDCKTNGFYWRWKGRLSRDNFVTLQDFMADRSKRQSRTEKHNIQLELINSESSRSLDDRIAQQGVNLLPSDKAELITWANVNVYPGLLEDEIVLADEAFASYQKILAKNRRAGIPPERLPTLYSKLMRKSAGPTPSTHGTYFQSKTTLPTALQAKLYSHCQRLLKRCSDDEEQSIKNAFQDTTRVWNRYTASGRHQRANAIQDLQKQYRASLMHDYQNLGINLQAPARKRLLALIETSVASFARESSQSQSGRSA
ncbi:hypothetical protein EMMF5_002614 [Cystobasidiomycetes sp. EMM_F5]